MNYTEILRKNINLLKQMRDMQIDDSQVEKLDVFQIEYSLNSVLDIIELGRRYNSQNKKVSEIEDTSVELSLLLDEADRLVEECKVKYHLDNCFFRDHINPELFD